MRKAKKKLLLLLYLTLLSVLMLAVVTYAWMSIAATLTLSDLELTILTDGALEVAPNENGQPGNWITIIDFEELMAGRSTKLRPVTFDEDSFTFRAVTYGLDGRINGYSKNEMFIFEDTADGSLKLVTSAADEKANGDGYFIEYDFWLKNMMTDCVLRLSKNVVRNETENPDGTTTTEMGNGSFAVGVPVWNDTTFVHESAGNGAQNSMRMLFLIEPEVPVDEAHAIKGSSSVAAGTSDTVNEQTEDAGTSSNEEETKWQMTDGWSAVIYEPNAPEVTTAPYVEGEEVEETTVTDKSTAPVIIQRHITQASSGWNETDPVLKDEVIYTSGDFTSESALCTLRTGYMVHIHVYVWIEGSDPDCTNAIADGRVLVNLQFIGDTQSIDDPVRPASQGVNETTTAWDDN